MKRSKYIVMVWGVSATVATDIAGLLLDHYSPSQVSEVQMEKLKENGERGMNPATTIVRERPG